MTPETHISKPGITATPVLAVEDLVVEFPTRDGVVRAVNGLSFTVRAGEVVGLVGESGCGKSTAAFALLRLVAAPGRIVAGRIRLDGQDLLGLAPEPMRRLRGPGIGMIFQDALTALDPRMTVGRQLMEPLRLHLGLSAAAARRAALELLEQVAIPSPEQRLQQYPHEFSGGMRQRVMIALALACRPRLLIADEPTTALDVTTQNQILNLLRSLRDQTGTAVLVITHDVGVVADLCDRVVVMYAGSEVECGPTRELFERPLHPYTRGLLSSTLRLDGQRGARLASIPGLPPELLHLPAGCPFYPRCAWRSDRCRLDQPVLEQVETNRTVSCWNWKDEH